MIKQHQKSQAGTGHSLTSCSCSVNFLEFTGSFSAVDPISSIMEYLLLDKSRILPGGSECVAYLLMYSSAPEFQRSHLYPAGNILPVVVVELMGKLRTGLKSPEALPCSGPLPTNKAALQGLLWCNHNKAEMKPPTSEKLIPFLCCLRVDA